jgi:hypothetical protein
LPESSRLEAVRHGASAGRRKEILGLHGGHVTVGRVGAARLLRCRAGRVTLGLRGAEGVESSDELAADGLVSDADSCRKLPWRDSHTWETLRRNELDIIDNKLCLKGVRGIED